MIFYNCRIHTMADGMIETGFIRSENGIIAEVGTGTTKAEDSCINLRGADVYPGFIDSHTHLGMWEDGLAFEGDDGNEETDPVTPQLRAIDAVNPQENCFREALESGVTTVITGPGSANAIGGQMAALKTSGVCIDNMIVAAPVAMKMALGENPKSVYNGKSQTPMTRMATAALIREQLEKAKEYLERIEKYEELKGTDDETDMPEYDQKCEALLPVLKRELKVHFHAHRADDIFTAARIADEFNLDYVIVHATEGHLIANELAERNIRVMSGPLISDRSKPELKNHSIKSPAVMSKAGLKPSIVTDHPVVPIQYLRLCAGLAVTEGLDYDEALKSVTCYPAEICGIENRVGSIEVGKDCDLTIFRCDPLSLGAKPEIVVVNGKIVYNKNDKEEQVL